MQRETQQRKLIHACFNREIISKNPVFVDTLGQSFVGRRRLSDRMTNIFVVLLHARMTRMK